MIILFWNLGMYNTSGSFVRISTAQHALLLIQDDSINFVKIRSEVTLISYIHRKNLAMYIINKLISSILAIISILSIV